MGQIIQPLSMRSIGGGRNVLSMAYDFQANPPALLKKQTFGAFQFLGESFEMDMLAIAASVSQNLDAFKSLSITGNFKMNNDTGAPLLEDGFIFAFCQDTNQIVSFGPTMLTALATPGIPYDCFVSAVVPFNTIAPTKIQVGKSATSNTTMHGQVYVNLYDFEMPAFVSQSMGSVS